MNLDNKENLKEERTNYLINTHGQVRDEIKMRIDQRDKFAIQFITSIGALLTLGFLEFKYSPFLFFLIPLITIFFSVQILYSYEIHNRCHRFLTEEIEPLLGELLEFKYYDVNNYMWESYCKIDSKEKVIKTPGIRKKFFEKISHIVPSISTLLFFVVAYSRELYSWPYLIIISVSLLVVLQTINTITILSFNKKVNGKALNKLSHIDYLNHDIKNNHQIKRVVFIDRDGTIHKDKVNTHKIEDLEYFDDTITSLKKLQELGYYLVIVTNQDGIRKGLYGVEQMHKFNMKIIEDFKNAGITISAIYYAPYSKIDDAYSFKPNPGMLLRAKEELNIKMDESYFIGDQVSDVVAAYRAKVIPIMVTTGIYKKPYLEDEYYQDIKPQTFENLTECVEYIEKK